MSEEEQQTVGMVIREGANAFWDDRSPSDCPYRERGLLWSAWQRGYEKARREIQIDTEEDGHCSR